MTQELARRIVFTIGALLVFRLGTHISITGMWTPPGPFESGAVASLSIFSLNLFPYLSAAIIIRLLSMVWGRLTSLERSGENGRRRIARYTLLLTLLLGTFQAYGIASTVQSIRGLGADPGGWFVFAASASMAGGVFFLVWLSEQITRHGIGNGLALVLSVGILSSLPEDVAAAVQLVKQGAVSGNQVLAHTVFWLTGFALIIFVESARRNVRVEFAERKIGERVLPARSAVLPLKINNAGLLVPVTVAPWVYLPLTLAAVVFGDGTPWLVAAQEHVQFAKPAHLIVGAIATFVLAFIYTAYVIDPQHAADSLRKLDGVIPGVEPGEPTANYLDRVVSLTTVIGAVYLSFVSLIQEAWVAYAHWLPYRMSGGAALIVVCTVLDIRTQVRDLSLTSRGDEYR